MAINQGTSKLNWKVDHKFLSDNYPCTYFSIRTWESIVNGLVDWIAASCSHYRRHRCVIFVRSVFFVLKFRNSEQFRWVHYGRSKNCRFTGPEMAPRKFIQLAKSPKNPYDLFSFLNRVCQGREEEEGKSTNGVGTREIRTECILDIIDISIYFAC